jgi:hypothetical protein
MGKYTIGAVLYVLLNEIFFEPPFLEPACLIDINSDSFRLDERFF